MSLPAEPSSDPSPLPPDPGPSAGPGTEITINNDDRSTSSSTNSDKSSHGSKEESSRLTPLLRAESEVRDSMLVRLLPPIFDHGRVALFGSLLVVPAPVPTVTPHTTLLREDTDESLSDLTDRQRLLRVVMLGVIFLLIYTAYSTAKNFMTKLFGSLGYHALALLYFSFALSSLVAPSFTALFGARKCLFFGGLCYALFILSIVLKAAWFLMLSACLCGLGAAVMWNGQALYLTKVGNGASLSTFTGYFFSIYQASGIIGNSLISFLYSLKLSTEVIFLILLAICGCGVGLILFLPSSHCRTVFQLPSLRQQMRGSCRLLRKPACLLLLPSFLLIGSFQPMLSGVLPPRMDSTTIGLVFCCYSACCIASSLAWGKVVDRWRWAPIAIAAPVLYAGGLLFAGSAVSATSSTGNSTTSYFVAYALIGLADSGLTVLITTTLVKLFPRSTAAAFACYRAATSVAQGAGFLYGHDIDVYVFGYLLLGWAIASHCVFAVNAVRHKAEWDVQSSAVAGGH